MMMSEFEQMMADIAVPEMIAKSISEAAKQGEVAAVWEELAPLVDKTFGDCSTAAGVCAVSMMVAYVGDKLAEQVKFGESPEDEGENVHPNFCIMAIALMAVNTLKASKIALEMAKAAKNGDGDGGEEEGKEKGGEEEGQEEGAESHEASGDPEANPTDS
jgi:hypothetical protein